MRIALILLLVPQLLLAGEGRWSVDFEKPSLEGWHLPLPEHWEIAEQGGNRFLRLKESGPIGEPRRPVKFALWEPGCVSDFELQVKVRRAEKSLAVAFGFQDRLHFYYAHMSVDEGITRVHNGLFKVDGGERFRIGGSGARPVLPDQRWHTVRIVRKVATGAIDLFVDGARQPRFRVIDNSFQYGWVGLGSFDETGDFDDFRLAGTPSSKCRGDTISPLDTD